MTQSSGQSPKRALFGAACERHVRKKYGLKEYDGKKCDLKFSNGKPVEVKSTQYEKQDGRGGTKPGEYYIFEHRHRWLARQSGYYCFVVYRPRGKGVQVLDTRMISVSDMPRLNWVKSGSIGRQGARESRLKVSQVF